MSDKMFPTAADEGAYGTATRWFDHQGEVYVCLADLKENMSQTADRLSRRNGGKPVAEAFSAMIWWLDKWKEAVVKGGQG